ncbi:ABC transporter substrate-binding protein [Rhodovarius crocodyli]|uniref:ABC transporter substrate-binding protein n=1 Tax=Rhodovarius crocodyli TaxID=1979269 RepID=A0A437M2L0_9PROT|nr:ABC transporter substrate-binding protein [Rhodovarius crocodyli]RVT91744.1 ABC transporter substrate-binding protein [Rhodovarius crocodyli]
MHRRALLQTSAAAAMAAPAAVRAQGQSTLRFIPASDLTTLDPHLVAAWAPRNHAQMVYDSLYGTGSDFKPVPQMAAGHSIEQDGRLWKITLREGLRWHDGQPVLARDCVASLRRWGTRHAFGAMLMRATAELSAPDDKTIQFRLHAPFPHLLEAISPITGPMCAMMPERLAQTDAYRAITEIIGSGPFRYVANERVAGARNVYQKFEGYVPRPTSEGTGWTADPKVVHFERVVWTTIPDPATAASAMISGEQDWWETLNPDLAPLIGRSRHLRTEITDKTGILLFIRPNHLQPPFNNPAIRRAVLGAIDQPYFMQALSSDPSMYKTPYGFFCPDTPMASDAGMQALTGPRDIEAAKRAIREAGYNGEKVTFLVGSNVYYVKSMCDVAADLFTRLGLNVDYVSTEWGTIMARREKQEPVDQGGWSCFVSAQSGADHLGPVSNNQLQANGTAPGSQAGWPTSPRLEELRTAWLGAPDTASQRAICEDVQRQAMQDVPYIPLGQFFQPSVIRNDITGVNTGFPTFWNVRRR